MGIAIIVPNVSFASSNLGKVTLVENDVPLTGLSISGESEVNNENNTETYNAQFTPTNTSQRGITWSIVAGNEFANINQNGVLNVVGTGTVTIKVVSNSNPSITASKTVKVNKYIKELYVRRDAESYIDLGVPMNQISKVELTWMATNNNVAPGFDVFGATDGANNSIEIKFNAPASSEPKFAFTGTRYNSTYLFETNKEYRFIGEPKASSLYCEGEVVEQANSGDSWVNWNSELNVYLFGKNKNGSANISTSSFYESLYVKDLKIYGKNGNVLKHFVGTEKDGTICLYEKENQEYVYPTQGELKKM